jgi:Cu2+-containing amine oxidase
VPEEFTTLRVASKVRKNSHSRPISYDLISQRLGGIRHLQREGGTYDADMDFINQDFWVTRTESGFTDYIDVPRYAKGRRSLAGMPSTIWLCTPALHVARSEDFGTDNGTNSYGGVAITTWAGFTLKPRDLFDGTPLYTPTPSRRFP